MPCQETIGFLDQYLDDTLVGDVRDRFESHLNVCPYCCDYLQTYRETIRMTASLGTVDEHSPCPVPDEVIRAVQAALRPSE